VVLALDLDLLGRLGVAWSRRRHFAQRTHPGVLLVGKDWKILPLPQIKGQLRPQCSSLWKKCKPFACFALYALKLCKNNDFCWKMSKILWKMQKICHIIAIFTHSPINSSKNARKWFKFY
jgi:hypothetical protein